MIQKTATKPLVAMPGYSRLFRRGAIYYFRVVVPRELRGTIGKSEIIKSLRTSNFSDAKRVVAFESADADSLFHSARAKLHRIKSPRRQVSKLSDAEIHRLVMEWFIQIEKRSEDSWQSEGRHLTFDERQEALENLGVEETALTAVWGDGGSYQPIDASSDLDQFLSERGIECAKESPEYGKLSAIFHEGRIANVRRDIARIEGRPRPAEDSLFRDLSGHTILPVHTRSITLGELLDRFLEYVRTKCSETTFTTYQTPTRVMREVLGEATPIHSISRESIDRLFSLLRSRPRNTSQRYRGLTTEQAISASTARGDNAKLSPKSLQNYYTNVLAVFNFAVAEKWLAENPAQFRSIKEQFRSRARKKKALFTPEQMNQIFHSPLYERPFRIADANAGRFFVPLLALFHGFRCNEACQLYSEDVKLELEIPFLAIREEREDGSECEKRLKNEASKRNVPIHPVLLRAGFMEFVAERRRDSASPRLFSELPLGKTGRYSNPFSKWFARFLRSVFTEKPSATFHSFRHHFRDALRAKRVGIEAVERLGGWRSHASQESEYGDGMTLGMLREEIEKVEYPGLELNHLYLH